MSKLDMAPERYHIIPINDLREHEATPECWCCPTEDEEDGLVVHHAMDNREEYETGSLRLQ